jgi:hypothetical protein
MRISIRALGVVTWVLWVFLAIFAASALYSANDVDFSVGEMTAVLSEDGEVSVFIPMRMVNNGYYTLESFNVSTRVLDEQGSVIARAVTFVPLIERNEAVSMTQEVRLNLTEVLQICKALLFNDTELQVNKVISMTAAGVISVRASGTDIFGWGAPLSNFMVGEPEYVMFSNLSSAAQVRVSVPLSFENHAFFDVNGSMRVRVYNSAGLLIGEGETVVAARQGEGYRGKIQFDAFADKVTRNGYFEVFFENSFFRVEPLVIAYES